MSLMEETEDARGSFTALGASKEVEDTLARRDVVEPFEIQALVMKDALAGRDVLAKSQTGSGKTLGFAVPIVERLDPQGGKPGALILVPTRELASQVVEEIDDVARCKGLRVAAAYGGVSVRDQAQRVSKANILVATPGRLQDLIDRRLISLKEVSIFVLDEADRMLDMGFQPQVDSIVRSLKGERQTMFFSATLDGQVGFLAQRYTHDPATHSVKAIRETVEDADHVFISTEQRQKVDKLIEIANKNADGLTLVFVRTKRGADRLAYRLKNREIKAVAMHGDLTQVQRERALAKFESGKARVLIATDVAARGLDLDGITVVVNYDPPEDDKGYVHRVGRTARAGRSGTGITLVMPDQEHDVSRMAARLSLEQDFEAGGMKIAPPRMVYTSHRGNRSSLRPRPKRRF
ncbi:MAG: DEAD/DEAH box helicase [Actinomycetota bacterium]